jgi:hypothetical protein
MTEVSRLQLAGGVRPARTDGPGAGQARADAGQGHLFCLAEAARAVPGHYNFRDVAHHEGAGKDALAPGKHTIKMDFAYDGGGIGSTVSPSPGSNKVC